MPQTDFEQFRKERIQEEREAKQQVIQELAVLRAENAKLINLLKEVLAKSPAGSQYPFWIDCRVAIRVAIESTTPDPLYTAAPEMLEALMEIVELCEKSGGGQTINAICRKAANAHQKATGFVIPA